MLYPQSDEQKRRRQDRNWEVSSWACCFLGKAVNRETTKKKQKMSKLGKHKI